MTPNLNRFGLALAGWALMMPLMGQEPGTLDADFQNEGMLLLAPFGAAALRTPKM